MQVHEAGREADRDYLTGVRVGILNKKGRVDFSRYSAPSLGLSEDLLWTTLLTIRYGYEFAQNFQDQCNNVAENLITGPDEVATIRLVGFFFVGFFGSSNNPKRTGKTIACKTC